MAITYIDYIDKIKLSEDEVYEIADTKARSQIVQCGDGILNALTNSTYASLLADNALLQLSIIEDVAGTLDWITSHGAFILTDDTLVQEATIYFIYNLETGDYDPIVYPDPTKNPHEEGWYILDISDSQTKFIMAHLAVTTRGLWILPSRLTTTNKTIDDIVDINSNKDTKAEKQANANARQSKNYKILLSSDGMYLYNGQGEQVVKYGDSILLGSGRPFSIGSDQAYILYYDSDHDGVADSIKIGGGVSIGGSKTLEQVLDLLDNKLDSAAVTVTPSENGAIIGINGSTVEITNGTSGGTYYTWIRYSADANGANMQAEPDSTSVYIGIYVGPSSTAPTEASSYRWSRYRGQDGKGIASVLIEYGISDNANTQPLASSWQTTSPSSVAQGKWLWTRTTTTFTDSSTSATFNKSYIGTDGNDGTSVYVDSVVKDGNTTTITLVDNSGVPSTFAIADGTDGTSGVDGTSGYVHFAWADDVVIDSSTNPPTVTVTGFDRSNSTNKKYLGVYTDDNPGDDSSTATDYSWTLIRGADGVGISETKIWYGVSTASTLVPSNWSTAAILDVLKGNWVWTKNSTTYTDSTVHESYTKSYVGTDGEDGKSVNITSSQKQDGVVTITLTDQDGVPSTFTIADGTDGIDGKDGQDGLYIHFAWANSANGVADFSTDESEGRTYLGVYSSTVSADSENPGAYTWTLIKGADGTPGKSISDVEEWYGSSTASSVAPSSYDTSIITPSSDAKYIWNYEKIIYNSDTTNFSTTAPHIVATFSEDGTPGAPGQALTAITLYYLLSSVSATAPAYDNADWTTQVQTPNSTKRYVWNYEALSWNNWQGIENQTTVTRTAQRIISIFGATGKSLTDVTEYYAANNSTDSAPTTAEFGTTILTPNASSKYVWNYLRMDWLDDGIPSITTTAPHIIATFSLDGAPGQSLISVALYYFASNSTLTPTGNFTTEVLIPTAENKYIWNYELLTWDNWEGIANQTTTTQTNKHIIAVYGDKGTSLSTITNFYGSSTVNSATPTNYSTNAITPSSEHKYIWNYEVLHWDDDLVSPTTTEQHIIAVFSEDGNDGQSLISMTEYYGYSNDNASTPATFSTDVMSPNSTAKYIWNYELLLWDNWQNSGSTHAEVSDPHIIAMFSNGINATTVEYNLSTSGTSATGNWTTETYNLTSSDTGKWLWIRTTTLYDDSTSDVAITKSYIGTDGKDGNSIVVVGTSYDSTNKKTIVTFQQKDSKGQLVPNSTYTVLVPDGNDGPRGYTGENGYTTHFAWANSADGLVDFSVLNSTNKMYMGTYSDQDIDDSFNPLDYTWTLIKGDKGEDGKDGSPGADGAKGAVIVYPVEINWETGNAILKAVFIVDGYEVQPYSYSWTKITEGNTITILDNNLSTYIILNDPDALDAIYNCTVTWSNAGLSGYAIAGVSKLLHHGNDSLSDYSLADFGVADHAVIISEDNTDYATGLLSRQTGSLDLRSAKNAYDISITKVKSYITDIDENGIFVHEEFEEEIPKEEVLTSTASNGVHISDNVSIIRGGKNVALYGLEIRIGIENSNSVNISTAGMTINNSSGQQIALYGETVTIGKKDQFHIEIVPGTTNGEIGFYNATNKVAYVSGDLLNIEKTVVIDQMNVGRNQQEGGNGQWSWKIHQVSGSTQNNLYLKWLG